MCRSPSNGGMRPYDFGQECKRAQNVWKTEPLSAQDPDPVGASSPSHPGESRSLLAERTCSPPAYPRMTGYKKNRNSRLVVLRHMQRCVSLFHDHVPETFSIVS